MSVATYHRVFVTSSSLYDALFAALQHCYRTYPNPFNFTVAAVSGFRSLSKSFSLQAPYVLSVFVPRQYFNSAISISLLEALHRRCALCGTSDAAMLQSNTGFAQCSFRACVLMGSLRRRTRLILPNGSRDLLARDCSVSYNLGGE